MHDQHEVTQILQKWREGDKSAAEQLLRESYESLKNSQGENNPRTVLAHNRLNELEKQLKR